MTDDSLLKSTNEAFQTLRKSISLPADAQNVAIDVAARQMGQGHYIEALRSYAALMICNPENFDVHIGMANCLIELDAAELALQSACVAMRLKPEHAAPYYLSGKACWMMGHEAEALEDLTDSIEASLKTRNATIGMEAKRLLNAINASSAAR